MNHVYESTHVSCCYKIASTNLSHSSFLYPTGQIQYSSGRVLFFFDGNPFVCTGTVIDDGDHPDRTLILTAGHCAFKYDNNGGRFADYALFIPNQDETRGRGSDEN